MKFLGGFNFEAKERKIGNVAYVTSVSFKSNESKCLFRLKVVIYIFVFVYRNSILGDICQNISNYSSMVRGRVIPAGALILAAGRGYYLI